MVLGSVQSLGFLSLFLSRQSETWRVQKHSLEMLTSQKAQSARGEEIGLLILVLPLICPIMAGRSCKPFSDHFLVR